MPILRPLIKLNPIERFITENYNSSDIVGYYTYEVENKENEIWNNCIASTPFISPIRDMLQYVISNSFKYNGTYFLSLEFHNIIDKILLKTKYQKYKNDLQVFATITKSSDVRIVVKHKQNILDEQTIECPTENKSILLGTIAHIITEKLLFYKEYIKVQNLKTCIILLVGKDLKKPAKKLTFEDSQLIVPNDGPHKNDEFQDHSLMDEFNESDAHIAFNPDLKLITKLTLIDKIIFKPLILVVVSIALIAVILKSQSLIIQSETDASNKEYYSLSKKYRELKNSYPKSSNINDLVDLYNTESKMKKNAINASRPIAAIFSFNDPELHIMNINWHNPTSKNTNFQITIDLIYQGNMR